MFNELVSNAMHSTPQGFVGVSLIFVYFCVIVATAFYRKRRSHAPLRGDAFPASPLSRPTRIRSESNGFPSHQAGSAQRHP